MVEGVEGAIKARAKKVGGSCKQWKKIGILWKKKTYEKKRRGAQWPSREKKTEGKTEECSSFYGE